MDTLAVACKPEPHHIAAITKTLSEVLDMEIEVKLVAERKKEGVDSQIYWWKTATEGVVRGKSHYQVVQLQIEFFPLTRRVVLDFLCLPEEQKRKGKGRQIVGKILALVREMGYEAVYLESQESSYPFWLKVGFVPSDPRRASFPRAMVYWLEEKAAADLQSRKQVKI